MNKITTRFFQRKNKKAIHRLLCLFALLFMTVQNSWGQQVIGSFPDFNGGYESFATGTLSANLTGLASGTQYSAYSFSHASSNSGTIATTTSRTGTKILTWGTSGTGRKLYSTTVNTNGGVANTTAYTVQFYYQTSKSNALGSSPTIAISPDGSGAVGTAVASTITSSLGTWVLKQISVTSGTSAAATKYGAIVFAADNFSNTNLIYFDDLCVYAGAADDTAPTGAATSPSTTVVSGTSLTVNWTGAQYAGDGGGYVIVRSTSATAVTLNPKGIYAVGNASATGGGTIVGITAGIAGTSQSFTDTGLTDGTTYYYSIFAVDKAFNYDTAVTCNGTPTAGLASPTLTADTTSNNVDNNIDITFTDDATWRAAVTAVKIGSTTLTVTTDYVLTAGNLQLRPSGLNALLTTSGSKAVSVLATGYQPATVTQIINPGAVVAANSTVSIGAALAPSTTQTITITARDQYNNLVPGYNFIYDATITNANVTTGESYTIDGTPRTSTVNDSFVTAATNASGVATFTVTLPATIDVNDGISIQVQLANGITNVGSAFTYTQLPPQTITFGALASKIYGDANFTLGATATSGLTVTYSSSNTAVATVSGNTVTIVGVGTTNITASQAGNGSWAAAVPVIQGFTVTQKALTMSGLSVPASKVYNGNTTAVVSGTPALQTAEAVGTGTTIDGKPYTGDAVSITGTALGTYNTKDVATATTVTFSGLSLTGAQAGNYTLTIQSTAAATITPAVATLAFPTSALNYEGFSDYGIQSISTGTFTITSSNPDVATIVGNNIHYIGNGVTTITASQVSTDSNYSSSGTYIQTLRVIPYPIAAWNVWTSNSTTQTNKTAYIYNSGLDVTNITVPAGTNGSGGVLSPVNITRGAGAAASGGTSAFRTTSFTVTPGTPVSLATTANTVYFQIALQATAGKTVSISTIDAYFYAANASFYAAPGASSQFGYSLDGGTNVYPITTLPVVSTSLRMTQLDVSNITALQDVPSGTTILLRYYATGQTASTGWGFGSPNPSPGTSGIVATDGLVIGGDVSDSTTWWWNGSAFVWTNGTPTATKNAIITEAFDTSTSTGLGFTAKKLTINGSGSLLIKAGTTVTVQNQVINNVGANAIIVENTGSLVQVNDYAPANKGVIKYNRQTNAISNMDYTYWSSPVAGFTLGGVSPNTRPDKFYSFNSTTQAWAQESATTSMTAGVGYIIRGPETSTYMAPSPPSQYLATFSGVPNNGRYQISGIAASKAYLIGNPYPSALDADTFIDGNLNVLKGTLYFWTHNTPVGGNVYVSNDYASYNRTGPSSAALNSGVNNSIPTGKIASGQGFFANSLATLLNGDTTIDFYNAMRVGVGAITGNNSQFYKTNNTTNTIEKHRIWLNLTNTQGAFKQTLVGYVTGATNEYDNLFDGESLNANQYVDFYSINQSKYLSIQGRALPFYENDLVPLGFKTTITGPLTISIDNTDGLLVDQDVYLEDLLTNTITDLKSGNYTFNAVPGIYNNRFILRYTNSTLGVNDPSLIKNDITVYRSNGVINIYSRNEQIDNVKVYDLQGRLITEQKDVNSTTTSIKNLRATQQVLIVKVTTQDNTVVTKKVVN